MKYEFDRLIKREGTGSTKWRVKHFLAPEAGPEIVPFTMADMEFANAPEIIRGLKEYLDGAVLGYTGATQAYYEAVQGWMERRHGFRPEKEWFLECTGVIPAIEEMLAAWTGPGEGVLIMTPVYQPFRDCAARAGCFISESPLRKTEDSYEVDWEDFARRAADPRVTVCILCSPHNPVGRIWRRDELERIAKICLENKVFLIADEIHHDLVMPGYRHVSAGTLEKKYLENSAVCTAPGKSFNLAAMKVSNNFIPDGERMKAVQRRRGYYSLGALGYEACRLAYTEGESWLEELLVYLDGNRSLVEEFLKDRLPELQVSRLEATYLQWIDFRALRMEPRELSCFLIREAQWILDWGTNFGAGGEGFGRLNIACPRLVLEEALERLAKACGA